MLWLVETGNFVNERWKILGNAERFGQGLYTRTSISVYGWIAQTSRRETVKKKVDLFSLLHRIV